MHRRATRPFFKSAVQAVASGPTIAAALGMLALAGPLCAGEPGAEESGASEHAPGPDFGGATTSSKNPANHDLVAAIPPDRGLAPSARIKLTFDHEPDAGFTSQPGSVDATHLRASLDFVAPLTRRDRLAFSLASEYSLYDFNSSTFGEPWDDIIGLRFFGNYSHALDERWAIFAIGGLNSEREVGADFADSVTYSIGGGVNYKASDSVQIGFAVLGVDQLDGGFSIFPAPTLEWTISEQWALSSDTGRGPGLSLEYSPSEAIRISLRGTYRGRDFRLAEDNPSAPGGLGIDRTIPVYVNVDWNFSRQFGVALAAGVNAWRRIEIEDEAGLEVIQSDADPHAFFGFTVVLRF